MSFLINITSYISSLSKNVFNTKLINQSEIANIICLNLSYLFLVYPASSKSTIMTDKTKDRFYYFLLGSFLYTVFEPIVKQIINLLA